MPSQSKTVDLQKAVDAVRSGSLSVHTASVKFGVARSTLHDHVQGKVAPGAKSGAKTVFPMEVERMMATHIKQTAQSGFGISRLQLCQKAAQVAKSMNLKTSFRNGMPGKDWLAGFQKRHPDISVRLPTALSTARSRMLNEVVVGKYFDDVRKQLVDNELADKPACIWNLYETGVPLIHKPCRILAPTGMRNVPGRTGNCRDNVTYLSCINAAGQEIPPFIIVKGKTYKSLNAYNVSAGPKDTVYTYQSKAWMEDVLGVEWFQNHFLRFCGPDRPQIIFLDSHSSHETLGFIQAAKDNNIILLAFPPHTTQWLCPLDKSIFGPLSRAWSQVCTDFMSASPNNIVSRWEWPRLFNLAHEKAVTPGNIKSGFEKCGIHPFNPKAIPQSAFSPSQPFDRQTSALTSSATHPLPAPSHNMDPSPVPLVSPHSSCMTPSTHDSPPVTVVSSRPSSESIISTQASSASLPLSPDIIVSPKHTLHLLSPQASSTSTVSPQPPSASIISSQSSSCTSISPHPSSTTAVTPHSSDVNISHSALSEIKASSSNDEALNAIISEMAEYNFSPDGTMTITLPPLPAPNSEEVAIDVLVPVNWQASVDNLFALETATRSSPKPSKRRLTSHRILTSEDIINRKAQEESEKKQKEEAKLKRKLEREQNKANKQNKKPRKV